jgi:hypothetical protein
VPLTSFTVAVVLYVVSLWVVTVFLAWVVLHRDEEIVVLARATILVVHQNTQSFWLTVNRLIDLGFAWVDVARDFLKLGRHASSTAKVWAFTRPISQLLDLVRARFA